GRAAHRLAVLDPGHGRARSLLSHGVALAVRRPRAARAHAPRALSPAARGRRRARLPVGDLLARISPRRRAQPVRRRRPVGARPSPPGLDAAPPERPRGLPRSRLRRAPEAVSRGERSEPRQTAALKSSLAHGDTRPGGCAGRRIPGMSGNPRHALLAALLVLGAAAAARDEPKSLADYRAEIARIEAEEGPLASTLSESLLGAAEILVEEDRLQEASQFLRRALHVRR